MSNRPRIAGTGRAIAALAMSAAIVLSACNSGPGGGPAIETAPAERGEINLVIEELGVIESTSVASIIAPTRGRLIRILEDGSMVKKGDVLASLDTTQLYDSLEEDLDNLKAVKKDLESAIEQMTIDLRSNALDMSSSLAQLDLARVQLADVNGNLGELEYLRAANIVNQDQVRTAAYDVRRSEISTFSRDMELRSQVTGTQSAEMENEVTMDRLGLRGRERLERIEQTQERIRNAEIRSPSDGIFIRTKRWNWSVRRRAEKMAGEDVNEGEQLGTIPDMALLIVRSQVPESEMLLVKPGTVVELVFEALGNLQSEGTILRISPVAIERETSAGGQITAGGQTMSGEKVFEVEIQIARADPRMKPGLTARARVVLDHRTNVVTVPLEAVTTDQGKHYVIVQDGRQWRRVEVGVGRSNDARAEITSGISEGDSVLVSGAPATVTM